MKQHIKSDVCMNKGHARFDGWNFSYFCTLCMKGEKTDEIHQHMKCDECPDYVPTEYDVETI